MKRWKKYLILSLVALCLFIGLTMWLQKINIECKKQVYWDLAERVIFLDIEYYYDAFFDPCYCISGISFLERDLLPAEYIGKGIFLEEKALSAEEEKRLCSKLPLYWLENYIKLGGSKSRPFFNVVYGYALLYDGQKDRAIEEFLKAPDGELDLTTNVIMKEFGVERVDNLISKLDKRIPRKEIILYYKEKGNCEMALKHVKRGLQNAKVYVVVEAYRRLEKNIQDECEKSKEAKEGKRND